MNEVFLVIQRGIYRHAVWGIRTTLPDAVILAKEMLLAERDDHHCAEVVRVSVDGSAPEKLVGIVERRDHGRHYDYIGHCWVAGDVVLTWKEGVAPDA